MHNTYNLKMSNKTHKLTKSSSSYFKQHNTLSLQMNHHWDKIHFCKSCIDQQYHICCSLVNLFCKIHSYFLKLYSKYIMTDSIQYLISNWHLKKSQSCIWSIDWLSGSVRNLGWSFSIKCIDWVYCSKHS